MNEFDKNLANKLWKEKFGNKDIVKDFSETFIVKEEFNTGKRYSWNIDKYNEDYEDYYIANENFIINRNEQDSFSFNGINYFIDKDENDNFFFNSNDLLIDPENIRNIDSFIKKNLSNRNNKKYTALIISFKALKKEFESHLLNYFLIISKKFNNLNISFSKNVEKINIKILFEEKIEKILDLALIFSSSIPLFIHRLKEQYQTEIFEYNNFSKDGKFFNVFLTYFQSKKNYFILDEINMDNFSFIVFENLIFVNKEAYNELIKRYYSPNDFSFPLKINSISELYKFNYANKNFISYLKIVKEKNL